MRRWAAAALAGLLAAVAPTVPAGAAGFDLGWWLTALGSAHCTRDFADGDHIVCRRYDQWGNDNGPVLNVWPPWWCQLAEVRPGSWSTPLELRFLSPTGIDLACAGIAGGWWDGAGQVAGINDYDPGYVDETPLYLPRHGTVVRIW